MSSFQSSNDEIVEGTLVLALFVNEHGWNKDNAWTYADILR